VVAGLAGLLAAPAWAGVEYKIDMDGGGGPTGTGWTSANGGNRFDNATTADLGGGARCGFKSWSNAEERDRGYDPGCGWSDEWPDVLRDFSSPKTGIFIVWNIPEGEYDVTIYFRDWQWPPTVYDAVAHDATVFSVNHSDYVCGDLDSISDTHRLSTILYDPDGGGANYDAQPSLWFDKNVSMKNGLAGYLIQEYEPPVRPVPEPAGLSLFGLGGLALIRRRRRG